MPKKDHGHHGGAWKVAYADFVTAMMALFLTLWLTSQDEKIKEAIERAFRNPFASVTKESVGIIPNKDSQAVRSSDGNFDSASAVELAMLRKLADDLTKTLESSPEDPEQQSMKLDLLPEGLLISVFDRARRPIFDGNTAKFTDYGAWVFTTLAWEIARFGKFQVELEGHTEKGHAFNGEDYGPWDLTTDRANASRRKLLDHGVEAPQIRKIAGYADTMPMPDYSPTNEINRRVAVLLKVREERN
jgi:chemotaxis protein MotB